MQPNLLKRKSVQAQSPKVRPKMELEGEDNEDTTKVNFKSEDNTNEDSNGITAAI